LQGGTTGSAEFSLGGAQKDGAFFKSGRTSAEGADVGGGATGSGIGMGRGWKRLSTCRAAKAGDPAGTGTTRLGIKRRAAELGSDAEFKPEPTGGGVGVKLRENGSWTVKSLVGSMKGRGVATC
jgi:hypothetical protein